MSPVIGRLALTPMDVKTVDVEGVFRDFRACLNTFDDWASSFWSFSALDVAADGSPVGAPIHRTIGPSGILEVKECTRDQRYQITFYPNVSKDHVKALYASYQTVIAGLDVRLRKEWQKTFKPQWDDLL